MEKLVSLWWAMSMVVLPIKVFYYSQEGDLLQIEFMEIFFPASKQELMETSSEEVLSLKTNLIFKLSGKDRIPTKIKTNKFAKVQKMG